MRTLGKFLESPSGKLLKALLEIEAAQYPEHRQDTLKKRERLVYDLILKHAHNRVTITTFTNMMQEYISIKIDVFDKKYAMGNIEINLGSDAHEIWATKYSKGGVSNYNFKTGRWNESKKPK